MRYPPHISVPHTIRYPVWGTRTGGGRTRLRNPTSTGLLTRAVLTRVHMAHTCLCATVCLLSCWNCTMELYGGPPPNMVYTWQSNVYLEELMYGLAWPAVARVRHRPQIQSCDEYEMNIQYPILPHPMFVGIDEQGLNHIS
jgi:hypothetical protein